MDPCTSAMELLGLLLLVCAWLCTLTTTVLPQWLTMSTALLPIESYDLGLWETCVVQDVGGMECRAYDSLLGLSRHLKMARLFMCASLGAGLLGILLAVPGLYIVNACKEPGGERTKRALIVAGGVLGVAAGVLCLVPVCYMAHLAVVHFFDEQVPDVVPRWEFGEALYSGWVGGFLLVAAGLVLIFSGSCGGQDGARSAPLRHCQLRSVDGSRKRQEYV